MSDVSLLALPCCPSPLPLTRSTASQGDQGRCLSHGLSPVHLSCSAPGMGLVLVSIHRMKNTGRVAQVTCFVASFPGVGIDIFQFLELQITFLQKPPARVTAFSLTSSHSFIHTHNFCFIPPRQHYFRLWPRYHTWVAKSSFISLLGGK